MKNGKSGNQKVEQSMDLMKLNDSRPTFDDSTILYNPDLITTESIDSLDHQHQKDNQRSFMSNEGDTIVKMNRSQHINK